MDDTEVLTLVLFERSSLFEDSGSEPGRCPEDNRRKSKTLQRESLVLSLFKIFRFRKLNGSTRRNLANST
jgi:hypothetical protein